MHKMIIVRIISDANGNITHGNVTCKIVILPKGVLPL